MAVAVREPQLNLWEERKGHLVACPDYDQIDIRFRRAVHQHNRPVTPGIP
jgi:hypothetical protein